VTGGKAGREGCEGRAEEIGEGWPRESGEGEDSQESREGGPFEEGAADE